MTSVPRLPVPMTPSRMRSFAPRTLFQLAAVSVNPTAPYVLLLMKSRRVLFPSDISYPFASGEKVVHLRIDQPVDCYKQELYIPAVTALFRVLFSSAKNQLLKKRAI